MTQGPNPRSTYLAIATRQFADHGFHGVSLAALAGDAGVTKQALLHFFGTKERLYGDVLSGLADRLCDEIDAAACPDAIQHLEAYFSGMADAVIRNSTDARLVIRALLDSDPGARRWPLKPYLDRLTELVRALPGLENAPDDAVLAETYQIIATVQYIAISLPTVGGIYGEQTRAALGARMVGFAKAAIARLSV